MADELVWALADKPDEAPTQTLIVQAEPYLIRIGSKYIKIRVGFGTQSPKPDGTAFITLATRDKVDG